VTPPPFVMAALDGYSIEGGFDGPHQAPTCYTAAIALGQVPAVESGGWTWEHYRDAADLAQAWGFDGVRIVAEWARCEPQPHQRDAEAIANYRDVLKGLRERGLRSSLVVVDRVWPSWLGPEAWLLPWVPVEFQRHVEEALENFGDLLDSFHIFSDRDGLVRRGFLTGEIPPFRKGAREDCNDALTQIAAMDERARAIIPSELRARSVEVSSQLSPSALWSVVQHAEADEVVVRSLVRGSGPVATGDGLSEMHEGILIRRAPDKYSVKEIS